MKRRLLLPIVLLALAAFGQVNPWTTDAQFNASGWDTSHANQAMPDMSAWTTAFSDDFTDCSKITANLYKPFQNTPDTTHKWFTSHPGGTNAAAYSCSGAGLAITQTYTGGQWDALILSSYSANGSGYKQDIGYYETTHTTPAPAAGIQPWLAPLWRVSTFFANPIPHYDPWREIDIETYVNNGQPYTISDHMFPQRAPTPGQVTAHDFKQIINTGINAFDGAPHRDGILVTATYIAIEHDGLEVARRPIFGADSHFAASLNISMNAPGFSPDTSKTYQWTISGEKALTPPPASCYAVGSC